MAIVTRKGLQLTRKEMLSLVRKGKSVRTESDGTVIEILDKQTRQSNARNTATLRLASPDQFDENGAFVATESDNATLKTQAIQQTENSIIDSIPILTQGNISIAL